MRVVIFLLKMYLRLISCLMRVVPGRRRGCIYISRQSNELPEDYALLVHELETRGIHVRVRCKMLEMEPKSLIRYFFELHRIVWGLSRSRVCLLDTYCIPIGLIPHGDELTVIQIWHGLTAVKKFGYQTLGTAYGRDRRLADQMRMHKGYDLIVSGSRTVIPFFSEAFDYPESAFVTWGTPRIDWLLQDDTNRREKILAAYPGLKQKKNILYAPTMRGRGPVPADSLSAVVDHEKYNLIVSKHPLTQHTEDAGCVSCPEFSSLELLSVADYVVTDYSALSVEAAIKRKPVLFYVYDLDEYQKNNGLNIDLNQEMPGCVFQDPQALYAKIEAGDYDMRLVDHYRDRYVDNQNGNATQILADYIEKIIQGEKRDDSAKVLSKNQKMAEQKGKRKPSLAGTDPLWHE